jgi:uncharacterized protein
MIKNFTKLNFLAALAIGLLSCNAIPLKSMDQEPANPVNGELLDAAKGDNFEEVEAALNAGADINHANRFGDTALMRAADKGNTDIVKLLLKHNADVNLASHWYKTTALLNAAYRQYTDIVRLLIDHNANVNHADQGGYTVLMYAAGKGNVDAVRLLIDHNANVNYIQEEYGNTPLILAAFWNHLDIVRLLIEAGADVNHADNRGETSLIMAAKKGHTNITKLLIEHGAKLPTNPELIQIIRNQLKKTIGNDFIVEVILGNTERVSQLLDQAPVELTHALDITGKTALHWAAAQGNDDIVRLLLDHGFTINAQDADGNTPLHLAARNGNLSTVKLLLARGANATLVNRNGQTPLALAYRYHRPDVVAFLEREAGRAVFGRVSRLGRRGEFAWQSTPTGATLPPEIAAIIAQFALAPGHIPQTESVS